MLVLAFMGIFLMILATLTSYAFQQSKYGRALYGREQALHIAESGLEYYRWFLAHFPNNLTNGTGQAGPYTYTVNDPEGGQLGSASLTITGNLQCNVIQSIDITSEGTADLNPGFPRTISARYMRPSVAAYSYLLNSNVWAGADRNITGPYFSNGGIRMDGNNNSDVQSALSTWSCNSAFGCSPTQTKNGVFGAGSGSALWSYPAATIDFAGIGVNLSNLKTYAQSNGGRYYAAASGNVNHRGYHIIFKANGRYDIYRVTGAIAVSSYSEPTGWITNEYSIINTQTLVASDVTIPSTCSVIFVEDRVWVEGTITGKVTLAAATPSNTGTTPTIYLVNNITYATNDGTVGFTAIAEGNVLIPLNSPDTMTLSGVFVAHNGRYGRNLYVSDNAYDPYDVPEAYNSYVFRTQLTTIGTVVSSLRTGTSWTSGGVASSGYLSRIDAYDQTQATNPPPFTPSASTDYRFVLWREQ